MLSPSSKQKVQEILIQENFSFYHFISDAELLKEIISGLTEPYTDVDVTKVVALGARGFIMGGAVANRLSVGFVPIRKGGKFDSMYQSAEILSETVVDYSRTEKTLELPLDEKLLTSRDKVLLVDEWFEAGVQGKAAINLIEQTGAQVIGVSILLDQMQIESRKYFENYNLHALIPMSEYQLSAWF